MEGGTPPPGSPLGHTQTKRRLNKKYPPPYGVPPTPVLHYVAALRAAATVQGPFSFFSHLFLRCCDSTWGCYGKTSKPSSCRNTCPSFFLVVAAVLERHLKTFLRRIKFFFGGTNRRELLGKYLDSF